MKKSGSGRNQSQKAGERTPAVPVKREMTAKQRRFVDEYMVDMNATQAAIRVGYSEKYAFKIGSDLLKKTIVSEEISRRMSELSEQTGVTARAVIDELQCLAYSNMGDYAEWGTYETEDGKSVQAVTLKDSSDLTRAQLAAVSKIVQTKDGLRLELYDKVKALELLGKHIGMFTNESPDDYDRDVTFA